MTNKYYSSKKASSKQQLPAGQPNYEDKEVWIQVQSEGVGGSVQTIGTQKLNLSKFVAQYNTQQTFLEMVAFPPGGLVGDLELQVVLRHIQKGAGG